MRGKNEQLNLDQLTVPTSIDNAPWEGGRFKKRPVEIDAYQWFKNGDHPHDVCVILSYNGENELTEGKIVRRFNHPGISGSRTCEYCYGDMKDHGWIDTLEGGHIVCPGDWIITGVEGEHYPIKDGIFHKTYEPVEKE